MNLARLGTLALLLLTAAFVVTCASTQPRDSLRFSHRLHVKDQDTACSECHGEVAAATDMGRRYLPKEAKCMDCHSDAEKNCAHCHTQPKAPEPVRNVRLEGIAFDHSLHTKRFASSADEQESACATCHEPVIEAATPLARPERPGLRDRCMRCHKTEADRIGCTGCHTGFVELTEKPFDMFSHRGDFEKRHGMIAPGNEEVCSHCHDQSSCLQCHAARAPMPPGLLRAEKVQSHYPHRGDVRTNHAIEARVNPESCGTCHSQRACAECHERERIAALGGGGLGSHPAGFMARGSRDFHGTAARRNISACATCHDRGADTNCIACHRVGGSGGSPHAPGWSSRVEREDGRVCRWCHR